MNKLCESNFEDVYKKISNIVFSVTDLEKLTLKLITKIITEKLFIELYIKMIYKLLINHNWIVKNVSFRQILLENIKKLYYEDNNISLFYLIGYLFKYKIFSFSLITNILDEYTNLKELYYDCALAISINLTSNNKIKFSYLHLYCSGISHKINFQTHLEQISYILDKFEVSSCINIMYIINIDIILFIYNKYNGKIQIKVLTDGEFENESRLKNLDNLLVI